MLRIKDCVTQRDISLKDIFKYAVVKNANEQYKMSIKGKQKVYKKGKLKHKEAINSAEITMVKNKNLIGTNPYESLKVRTNKIIKQANRNS